MTDEDSILFPSLTVCKDEMLTVPDKVPGLQQKEGETELSVEEVRVWFKEKTLSISQLVKFLSVRDGYDFCILDLASPFLMNSFNIVIFQVLRFIKNSLS